VRVATFNVLHGASPDDDRVDLLRFAAAVRALDADVLALQEVDRAQPRSAGADLTSLAAEAGGYAEHRFVPALHGLPGAWGPAGGHRPDTGPAYGLSLLSRLPVRSWDSVHLAALPVPAPVVFHHSGRLQWVRDEPRVAVVARIEVPGGPVTVAATHLSFLRGWNLLQLARLRRALGDEPRLVLVGDLNTGPRSARAVSRLRPLATAPTFPAHGPLSQLDHVLAGDGITGSDARVWSLPLSDHRALSVEVTPSPEGGAARRDG